MHSWAMDIILCSPCLSEIMLCRSHIYNAGAAGARAVRDYAQQLMNIHSTLILGATHPSTSPLAVHCRRAASLSCLCVRGERRLDEEAFGRRTQVCL